MALSCAALSAIVLALIGWTQDLYRLVPAALPDRRGDQSALCAERNLDDRVGAAGTARPHHGLLHVDHLGGLRGRTALPARRRHAWMAAFPGRHRRLHVLRRMSCLRARRLPSSTTAGHSVSVLGFVPLAWLLLARSRRRRRLRAGRVGADAGLRRRLRHRRSQDVGAADGLHRRKHRACRFRSGCLRSG